MQRRRPRRIGGYRGVIAGSDKIDDVFFWERVPLCSLVGPCCGVGVRRCPSAVALPQHGGG